MLGNGKALWIRTVSVIAVCLFVLNVESVKADFVFGEPVNLGSTVNYASIEADSCISLDGLSLYFGARRPGGFGTSWDIWVATRKTTDDAWGPAGNLGSPVNTSSDDSSPRISADGLTLFLLSDRPGGYGGYDIWAATRETTHDEWNAPVNLGPTINSSSTDGIGSLSPDGLTLYLFSDRPGGYGGWDMYQATRETQSGAWGAPVNLGPRVNSSSSEGNPCVLGNGRTLVFSSNRPGGLGAHDLYATTWSSEDNEWGEPLNLGPTINSSSSDELPSISYADASLYFSSNRPGGNGSYDLWQAPILPVIDFNGDGTVDSEDKSILMDHCGQNEPLCDIGPMPWGDGIVDTQDLWVLAEYIDVDDVVMVHTPSVHAADVLRDVTLHWLPAEIADAHDVYLGTSFEDVYAANRDDPRDMLVSQGQSANEFDPGQLAFGQTYYWRIDEVTATLEPTIYKGVVTDFTTESLAYPVENVSATASTSDAGAGPENTINGSGLSADDTHSTVATDMWLAGGNGVDPVWIQYEFDKVYKLHEMLIWNYNVQFELVLGFGLKDVTVEYSENGIDWTVLGDAEVAQATAAATYTANTTIDFGGVAAKYVRLTVNSGWGVIGKFGLSEVRFLHIPARAREPQPENGAVDVSPDTLLQWRPGREALAHEIYLSTDRQAVADGTALVDTVTENSYLPNPLAPGQTYYWKINELDEGDTTHVWEGGVWEFTTAQ